MWYHTFCSRIIKEVCFSIPRNTVNKSGNGDGRVKEERGVEGWRGERRGDGKGKGWEKSPQVAKQPLLMTHFSLCNNAWLKNGEFQKVVLGCKKGKGKKEFIDCVRCVGLIIVFILCIYNIE